MPLTTDSRLRLPPTDYFPTNGGSEKTGIAIHHTVGGTAESSVRWWREDNAIVGTAYIIERDGTVFEVFDPSAWAWQFGLSWPQAMKTKFERRFIGIEIASEGGLIEANGNLYCFDRVSPKTLKPRSDAFDYGQSYRGYRYFDPYEPAQVDSLCQLIDHLCDTFGIKRQAPSRALDFYGENLQNFQGIIGHAMVRTDKSDPLPDVSLWNRIMTECRLSAVDVPSTARPRATMNQSEIEALFQQNVQQLNLMNIAAGSMVKGLLIELQRDGRNTFIRLLHPVAGGHVVDYEFVQGDRTLVGRIARALGFKTATDSRLEVKSA